MTADHHATGGGGGGGGDDGDDSSSDDDSGGEIITSGDPNDIAGPTGYGTPRWISTAVPLTYAIYFTNEDRDGDGIAGTATDDAWYYAEVRSRINFAEIAAKLDRMERRFMRQAHPPMREALGGGAGRVAAYPAADRIAARVVAPCVVVGPGPHSASLAGEHGRQGVRK